MTSACLPYVATNKQGGTLVARFKNYRNADACTLMQVATGLGYDKERVDELKGTSDLTSVSYTGMDRYLSATPTVRQLQDVCALPPKYDPVITGISLDYEVHDGRTPAMAREFLTKFVDLVHGRHKEALLRVNPLNASTQQANSGMAGNENYLQSIFDLIDIEMPKYGDAAEFTRSFEEQATLLKNGPAPFSFKKIFLLARPAEVNSVALAEVVRSLMVKNAIPMLAFNGTPNNLGGSCDRPINRVLQVLARPEER